ncbi:tRNA (adenosine(37)-N6)-threonylcarbamoyltransferase complex dimerization subunit type 1 TsaB [Wenzhouxiangella sp. XN79A]|uniref:tRNA (adenosine(37)-N6)-threonylcarbamoyltransferase complex dimerization subunit type 1 TsaB n=1 Tax=Wenzhouxiangella sp. XN79A TaxID=2724193 RepID=UPI00144A7786|nr:tRNA (adenosine(37)-N6)-threonylcarbamoyltransferase complex dimerization subunit type 1 TsaB [Wenzhouxiangella sp. XN79A]NKI36316.1 tRNA (adenosine(37)-N6)-threonylcarbamoyltransferase complex dimerization subunit type 1 TsaB [Wenzhouxiangella sp. XN79A]
MNRLAIETAFETCSVALDCGGEVRSRAMTEPRAHGRRLLPFIDELLAEAGLGYPDLDALVVDRGPGSFTSLRIGLGVAQGLALAHDLPVHPVSSLAMIAAAGRDPEGPARVLAAMDARMGEIYAAVFRFGDDRPVLEGRELLCAPADLPAVELPAQGIGTAFAVHAVAVPRALVEGLDPVRSDVAPDASVLLGLAAAVDPVEAHALAPVYLRDNVAN